MHACRHVAIIGCYGTLAAAIVLALPEHAGVGRELALAFAAIVLLAGALLHERFARVRRERAFAERTLALGEAHALLHEDLCWTRSELRSVAETLERVASYARQGERARAIKDMNAEIEVLKSLVARLSAGRAAAIAPASYSPGNAAAYRMAVAGGAAPAVALAPPPEVLDEPAILDIVREALREDRIDIALQPVVSLPQRKPRFYECFTRMRTRNGALIVPEHYIEIAERAGLIAAIDNMLLFRCIQLVRKIQRQSKDLGFFCNISPRTLADTDFFADFVEFLHGNAELAPNLVFEFAHDDFMRQTSAEAEHVARLAKLGCRFSLDRVKGLELDAAKLGERRVRFVKIDADVLRSKLCTG
ncbi:MAG: EAL domain-containing protein, partial [Kiloniellales bacterium]